MNIEDRKNKVAGLEAIKNKALEMAKDGKDSLEVRDFVTKLRKSWPLRFQMRKHLEKQQKQR